MPFFHTLEGGYPVFNERRDYWIPAFAGMAPKGMRLVPHLSPTPND
jgi:hypothetical protein